MTPSARKRLLSELRLESEWLSQRQPCQSNMVPLFPSATCFFGCAPSIQTESARSSSAEQPKRDSKAHQLYTLAGPACILSVMPEPPASQEIGKRADHQRVRLQWASLCKSQPVFGDPVDRIINPQQCAVAPNDEPLQWVQDPFSRPTSTTAILAGTRRDSPGTTLRVLGDPAPLSPVIQPYPFYNKRNRRRACSIHAQLESGARLQNLPPEVKAYKTAWDREEPLSIPPTCSCASEAVAGRYQQLIKCIVDALTAHIPMTPQSPLPAVSDDPSKPPPPPLVEASVLREMEDLMTQQADCSACGGLQYYPFSFIETPLTHDCSSLLDFCERVPLPPNTEVFCDGPKVTACISCRSPQHEWEVYKALYVANEHRCAVIYDVCTSHYYPCHKPSKLYWSRSSIMRVPVSSSGGSGVTLSPGVVQPDTTNVVTQSPSSVHSPRSVNGAENNMVAEEPTEALGDVADSPLQVLWRSLLPAFKSPLSPPLQCPFNLSRCQPHSLFSLSGIPSLTSPDLRRVYCITPRHLSASFDPSAVITRDECLAIEEAHKKRVHWDETLALHKEVLQLRRQHTVADHRLNMLRQQAWGFRLATPDMVTTSPGGGLQVTQPTPRSVLRIQPVGPTWNARTGSNTQPTRPEPRRSPSHNRGSNTSQSKGRSENPGGGGGGGRRDPMPRYTPNAFPSAAASRIHAGRSSTHTRDPSSSSHNERR
eukprot:Blabericola_migrator_1__11119@NODE_649_length_7061_cov_165_821132_g475_i0_p1_GENE_NODE_649_length_7061_cov_165_821132_g475_i0NODE_649_length_7061_cov_165_821132_g475_i0_p1_ORF_typecomplete_len708_score82_74_NODE_649_length_7061_cov_165_821132_g475_i015843707